MMTKPEKCCPCGSYEHTVPMPIRGRVSDIDFCIARIVAALEAGNIHPLASCCGHGKSPGSIILEDGIHLVLLSDSQAQETIKRYGTY